MKRHSTFHALYLSFFSRTLYQEVAHHWRGTAFVYLLLLLAVSWIPIMFKLQANLNGFMEQYAPKLIRQIPEIRITAGEVSTDAAMPYFINDPDSGVPLIVIDTTGSVTTLDDIDARALLTKTKFMVKKNALESRTLELSQIDDLTIDQPTLRSWAETFRQWFFILLYPFVLLFSYAYRIVQVLLYAAIGKLFVARYHAALGFPALVALATVALTPVIVVNTVYNYLDIVIPLWWLICFIVAMSYLHFAVKANAGERPRLPG